jgi:hypothetical protein
MKKAQMILYGMVAFLATPFISLSQERVSVFSSFLSKYYELRNALVNSDAGSASRFASEFSALLKAVDVKTLAANEQAVFQSTRASLIADVNNIAAVKDLAKQRTAFETLSDNMIALAKTGKPAKPVYIDYCPMKKAYWLSEEQAIKNPYYGSSMLTCGKITETIK